MTPPRISKTITPIQSKRVEPGEPLAGDSTRRADPSMDRTLSIFASISAVGLAGK